VIKIALALLTALLLAACSPASGEPPAYYQERAGAAVMEAQGDAEQLEAALAIYDEGLERHPEDTELRNSRANLLAGMGRYEEAKRDLDVLHEKGLHKEGLLLRCMLLERLAGVTDDTMACYAEVEAAYVTADELDAQPDANHMLAARLADSPEFEVLLLEWQSSGNAAQEPMLAEMLEMEREQLVRQLLP
jgi:tetratricopeptide (TPR) repeat protein